jgi:Spy/CpxP family protein refolding chaperone
MKKVFLALLMVVGITAGAQEKEGGRPQRERLAPEQRVELQVKKLTKDLDLNEKQISAVRTLVAQEIEKREAKRAEMKEKKEMNGKAREEAKAAFDKERAANDAEMKKILTPEQYAKWERIRDERISKMKEKVMERREEKAIERGAAPINK